MHFYNIFIKIKQLLILNPIKRDNKIVVSFRIEIYFFLNLPMPDTCSALTSNPLVTLPDAASII